MTRKEAREYIDTIPENLSTVCDDLANALDYLSSGCNRRRYICFD
jgi:hypothetical protein